jgi:hypothetical protein
LNHFLPWSFFFFFFFELESLPILVKVVTTFVHMSWHDECI